MKTIHTIPFLAAAWLACPAFLSAEEETAPLPPGAPGEIAERFLSPEATDPLLRSEIRRLGHEMRRAELMLPEARRLRIERAAGAANLSGNPRWMIGLNVEPIEPFIRTHLRLEGDTGVRVSHVAENSAAAKAGIKVDDILVSVGGQPLPSLEALREAVEKAGQSGSPLALEAIQNGERKSLVIVPTDTRPEPAAGPGDNARERRFAQIAHRLDRQQREIEALRKEVAELKKKLGAGADE